MGAAMDGFAGCLGQSLQERIPHSQLVCMTWCCSALCLPLASLSMSGGNRNLVLTRWPVSWLSSWPRRRWTSCLRWLCTCRSNKMRCTKASQWTTMAKIIPFSQDLWTGKDHNLTNKTLSSSIISATIRRWIAYLGKQICLAIFVTAQIVSGLGL